jgi:hypothetical protein
LNSRRNPASAYRADSRTREAEALLEPVLANYERTLGHDHPYTKTARENLSSLKGPPKFIVQTGSAATLMHDPISMSCALRSGLPEEQRSDSLFCARCGYSIIFFQTCLTAAMTRSSDLTIRPS